ncbi:MAG TPA: ABC transporter permease [Gammaproteobacteria bacterium]|nr:ABC transporter permease [Gammaproteobacteria bacterium]
MGQFKHAVRQLVLRPALSATVIAMLAIGIGATTAIYSLMHFIVLQPIEAPHVDELVSFRSPGQKFGTTRGDLTVGEPQRLFSYPMYRDLAAEQTSFTGIAAHYSFLASMEVGENTTRLAEAVLVSGNYFSVLNVNPELGRVVGPEDARVVGESLVAVLSYEHWQNHFAGDPNVVGKTLTVNNQDLTIIGVTPEWFTGMMRDYEPLVYVPLTLRWLMQPEEPRNDENAQAYWLTLFARLKPGVSLEQARVEMGALYRGMLSEEAPRLTGVTEEQRALYLDGRLQLDPGSRGQIYREIRPTDGLTLAFGATLLVLLIACVNVANLLLARGASRGGEMAIRSSIGASRGRLVAQLLAESTVLALVGGVLAIPAAMATLRFIQAIAAGGLPSGFGLVLNPPVVLFAAAITLGTVVVFGLVPALSAGRTDTAAIMKAQSARSAGGRGLLRFRNALVALQISLSLVLLVLAGLFTRSLLNVSRIDYGMDIDSIVQFSVTPLLGGYSGERLDALYERVREEIAATPGVEAVGTVAFPLFYGIQLPVGITVLGADEQVADSVAQANPAVGPGFFDATSIPLRAGRDFTAADSTTSPSVVIVNESFVRKFELGDGAVGTTLRLEGRFVPQSTVEIVGVVGDAKYSAVKPDIPPQVFAPRPAGDAQFVALFYYVRASIEPGALARVIPDVVKRVDPNIPASNLTTMRALIDSRTRGDSIMSTLSATFAGLATVLAAIGLYAVLAFSVAQRKRELGLRLALGAQPSSLRSLVLAQVGRFAIVGGGVGLLLAFAVGRLAEASLFGLQGYDPVVFASAVGGLAVVVAVASWLPALRASNVAPMEALRYE